MVRGDISTDESDSDSDSGREENTRPCTANDARHQSEAEYHRPLRPNGTLPSKYKAQ